MKLSELRLPEALPPSAADFVARYGEAIGARLDPALPKLEADLRALGGPDAAELRRHYLRAEATWEKFFWVRLGAHHITDERPLESAVQLAAEDLRALTATLHAL